jgi:hypothetical protein
MSARAWWEMVVEIARRPPYPLQQHTPQKVIDSLGDRLLGLQILKLLGRSALVIRLGLALVSSLHLGLRNAGARILVQNHLCRNIGGTRSICRSISMCDRDKSVRNRFQRWRTRLFGIDSKQLTYQV